MRSNDIDALLRGGAEPSVKKGFGSKVIGFFSKPIVWIPTALGIGALCLYIGTSKSEKIREAYDSAREKVTMTFAPDYQDIKRDLVKRIGIDVQYENNKEMFDGVAPICEILDSLEYTRCQVKPREKENPISKPLKLLEEAMKDYMNKGK